MKIGIITNLYPPYARGGAENVIVRTVGQLMAMGHEVFVITGHPKELGERVVCDASSTERIYRFFPRNLYFTLDDFRYPWLIRLGWHIQDAFSWHGAEHVRSILREEEPDVVITHNLKGIGLNIPSVIRDLCIPHIHVVHDLQLLIPSGLLMFGQERPHVLARLAYAVYQRVCATKIGNPDVVLFPSEYLKQAYEEKRFFTKSDCRLMRNPAPAYAFVPKERRPQGEVKLLFAGQLGYHKGIRFLLETLSSLEDPFRLYVAGTGPLKKEVEAYAQKDKRIVCLGYTPPEELAHVFGVVDGLVMPSLCYENSPTVIYEALIAGIPVLASRIGGVGELLSEGKTGMLFTPGDREDFLRVFRRFSKEKEAFSERRQEIRASVSEYALDRYAQRLEEVILELQQKRTS